MPTRIRPLPRRLAVPWIWFALVHLWVAIAGLWMPNLPTGDVVLVYEPWSEQALAGSGIVGVTSEWVYPQLALAPMILARAFIWLGNYTLAWAAFATLCDAVGFWFLLGRGTSRGRKLAAGFWLVCQLALGPVGMYRLDAITVPMVIIALCWLVTRPTVAGALLAAAVWIKVWPAAVLAAAFAVLRRRWAVVTGAIITTALVVGVVLIGGGAKYLIGFVSEQSDRGLQIEAPVSTIYMWGAALKVDGWWVYYDQHILTFQVTGSGIDTVIALMTPLMVIALAAILVLGFLQAARGAHYRSLLPPLALALVLGFIVFNKVGSPQYQTWLIAPVVLWLIVDRRRAIRPALAVVWVLLVTQIIYPLTYTYVMAPTIGAVILLTARNLALVGILWWMVVRLVRVPTGVRALRAARVTVSFST
ncbi:MAG: glycosyltransferase 87 family protein [Microbacterium sp.]